MVEGDPKAFTFKSLSTRRVVLAFDMVLDRESKQRSLNKQCMVVELSIQQTAAGTRARSVFEGLEGRLAMPG